MRHAIGAILLTSSALLARVNSAAAQSASTSAGADAPQSGVVRGLVTAKLTGAVLPRSVITIEALELQQFSNDAGRFYFVKVKPGTYRLNVRQLGYLPVNVDIVVDANGTPDIRVQMDRIPTKLSEFKVSDQALCARPGRPTAADGEQIVNVFEQLEQGAVRLALLARQYPYRVSVDRRTTLHDVDGKEIPERSDSFLMQGQKAAEYEPGKVVRRVSGQLGAYSFQIPTLLDFADKKFIQNHCFVLRGLERLPADSGGDGTAFVRVDFQAASKLGDPDVNGSVYLDSADYRLRRAVMRMSKIPNSLRDITAVRVTTTFEDFVAGMPIVALVRGITDMHALPNRPFRIVSRTEQQTVTNLIFTKQRPDSALRPPR